MKVVMSEDYIRPFGACYKGNVYHADAYASGYYTLIDHYGDEFVISEDKLKKIASVVVEPVEPTKVTVSIWHRDISIAAKWLHENHYLHIFKSPMAAEDAIYRTIYHVLEAQANHLKEHPESGWAMSSGGAGYSVQWQWEDEEWADISVTIDPSVAIGDRKGVHVVSEGLDTLIEFYHDYKGH